MNKKEYYKKYKGEKVNRRKAIRLFCLDCCCDSMVEVRECQSFNCPLYMFRMGSNGFNVLENKEDSEEGEENG